MVVHSHQERGINILPLHYCYGSGTFQVEYREYYRRRMQALRADDSATV